MPKKRGNNEGSITKRKDGRRMARVTVGRDPETGQLKRVSLYGKTRQEVADAMAKALSDKARGTFVKPEKITVGEWLDTWLEQYKRPGVRAVTYDRYEIIIRRHLVPFVGHIPLKDLRPEHLQQLYNERIKSGLNPSTVRLFHGVIHEALEQAVKNQLVLRNVSEATVLPKERKKEIQPLTLGQVRQLLTAIEEDQLYPAIVLEINTGLRRGELLGLRWQDVDFPAGVLHVRQALSRVRCHGEDGPKRFRFHDARHTFATLMLELGEHPKTVQTMLGHSRIAMTLDLYSHVSLELEKRAAQRLGEALRGEAKPSRTGKR